MEATVSQVWASVLDVPVHKINARTSFRELGGDSLTAMRIVSMLRGKLAPTEGKYSAVQLLGRVFKDGRWIQTLVPDSIQPPSAGAGAGAGAATPATMGRVLAAMPASYGDERTGRIKGTFAPGCLLQRPVLADYAAFVVRTMAEAKSGAGTPLSDPKSNTNSNMNSDGGATAAAPATPPPLPAPTAPPSVYFQGVLADRCKDALVAAARHPTDCGVQVLLSLLQSNMDPTNPNAADKKRAGFSPLHAAAATGNTAAVQLLLSAGAVPTAFTTAHAMPIHYAAGSLSAADGNVPVLRLLLEKGNFAPVQDNNRQRAMHWAVRCPFPTEIYTRGCHWIPRMFACSLDVRLKRTCV
jgi:hypothetical protein